MADYTRKMTEAEAEAEAEVARLVAKGRDLLHKASPAHPDYRVTCGGVDIGAGWININQTTGKPYTSLTLAHPDLGPRAYKVNLGRAPDQDDDGVYALIWNPEP